MGWPTRVLPIVAGYADNDRSGCPQPGAPPEPGVEREAEAVGAGRPEAGRLTEWRKFSPQGLVGSMKRGGV